MEDEVDSFDAFNVLKDVNQTSRSRLTVYKYSTILRDWYDSTEYIDLILCILSLMANVFVAITILRFKKLWTRMNFYLLNIALTSGVYYVARFSVGIAIYFRVRFIVFCYTYWIQDAWLFTEYLLAAMLTVDWYLVNFMESFVQTHLKIYRFLLPVAYLIGLVRFLTIAAPHCNRLGYLRVTVSLLHITQGLPLAIALVVNVLRHRRRNEKQIESRYALLSANVLIVSWVPFFFYRLVFTYGMGSHIIFWIFRRTFEFPKFLAHSNGLILLYVLWKTNSNFQKYFRMVFRRECDESEPNVATEEVQDEGGEEQVQIDTAALVTLSKNIRYR